MLLVLHAYCFGDAIWACYEMLLSIVCRLYLWISEVYGS